MKHERGIVAAPNWRLKKTLSRRVEFRPIENDDMGYVWAAYKKGALAVMGGRFEKQNMTAEEFNTAFKAEVLEKYDGAWTMFATTSSRYMPVGLVFGVWERLSPYMLTAGIAWFPWATKRNIVESVVNFFNGIRKKFPMVGYAVDEHKAIYEVCCRHGIMRRIGTSFVAFPGKSAAVFETRE